MTNQQRAGARAGLHAGCRDWLPGLVTRRRPVPCRRC